MAAELFVPADALEYGWDKATDHLWFFFKMLMLCGLIQLLPVALAIFVLKSVPWLIALGCVYVLISSFLSMGFTNVILVVGRGERPRISDLFSKYRTWPKFLLASFLAGLLISVGYLLFVAPGVILTIRLLFFGFVMLEMDMGPVESMKESWAITRDAFWHLFMLGIGCAILCGIGFMFCLGGLFAALPTALMAVVYAFRTLMYGGPVPAVEGEVEAPEAASEV